MSALDKAFLKAYTRQTEEPGQQGDRPAAGLPAGDSPAGVAADQPLWVTQPCLHGKFSRIDAAHQPAGGAAAPPHAEFVASAGYGDQAIVGPYYDEATIAQLTYEPPASAEVQASVASAGVQVSAAPAGVQASAASDLPVSPPPVSEPAPEMKRAAALRLPTVFLTPAEEEVSADFSPDWEVDRFSWPELCERLLEIEHRYFRHVGQRLKAATDESHHVVMVSGCRRGEGRTTLALCLARSAAAAGVQVALVDADFRNPQMGMRLGMEIPCGWMEVLRGKAPLNEAAVASVEDQLTLFPLKSADSTPVPAGDERLIRILRRISAHYPLVIVDAEPLGAEDRHPFAGPDDCPVDAAIVLRDLRYTTEKKALATAERLQQSGIGAVGIAENFESR